MIPQATQWTEDGALVPASFARRALPKNTKELAPVVEREQRQPAPGAGRLEAIVPVRILMRKLGATTYRVWATLLTMRDPTCETHPSLPGLARAAGVSVKQTAKSMARLRDFKLVEDFGFVYRQVPCSCKGECWGHKVYIRNVYGQVHMVDTEHFVAKVPAETLRLVMAAAGQGGKRKGAGRPKKAAVVAPSVATSNTAQGKTEKSKGGAYKNQILVPQKSLKALLLNKPRHSRCVSGQNTSKIDQPSREALDKFLSSQPRQGAFGPPLQPKAQPATVPAAREALGAATAATARKAPSACTVHEREVSVASDDSVVVIDGVEHSGLDAIFSAGNAREIGLRGTPGPRQRFTPDDVRLTTQLSSELVHLRVPPPPKVREEHTADERLALLKAAYRAAHEKAMRTDYWRRGKPQPDKERASQLEAAGALLDEGIAPTAWARHAFSMWLRVGNTTAPLPRWVWSAQRIREHAAWCRDAVGPLDGGPADALPATRMLYMRLGQLQQRLGWGRPTDVVLSEVLPQEDRAALLEQQAAQHAAWKQDIRQRIRNGEWVWG